MNVLRTCPSCGAENRVPARHLASAGRCGACKAPLAPQSAPIDADPAAFAEIVREAPVPVLVDFWAPWCGPCRIAAPMIRDLAAEAAGKALVLKVNTEEHPGLASQFAIQAIPTFVVLRGGTVVSQRAGVAPPAEMRRWLGLSPAGAPR